MCIRDSPLPVAAKEPVHVNSPGASTEKEEVRPSRLFSLVRTGMVLASIIFLLSQLIKISTPSNTADGFQKVATNYNVSPKTITEDVIVASIDGAEAVGESAEEKAAILQRQKEMTAGSPVSEMSTHVIITNTFGNANNVEKQLNLISELGYEGSTWEKSNGLVSTLITLESQGDKDLDTILEEIKVDFPRARFKQ